jgi:hypothetical protein
MYIIIAIISYSLGLLTYFLIDKLNNGKNESSKVKKRRGIYSKSFTVTEGVSKSSADCQYELEEIERTKDKSKVKVLSLKPGQSKYLESEWMRRFKDIINETWIDSSEIDWIEDDLAEKRNQKIDELLNERDKDKSNIR